MFGRHLIPFILSSLAIHFIPQLSARQLASVHYDTPRSSRSSRRDIRSYPVLGQQGATEPRYRVFKRTTASLPMFTCASPRRRATVSSPRTNMQRLMPVSPLRDGLIATGNGAKPRALTRRAPFGERQRHLDTIPERPLGSACFNAAVEPKGSKAHIPNLQAPPPVVHAPAFGHKRMMSAPTAHLHVSPIAAEAERPVGAMAISRIGLGNDPEWKLGNVKPAANSSRLKRASTISTVDSRLHSLLIPSDSRADSMLGWANTSSDVYTGKDTPCAFPRWGNAPSVSSFIMADGSINETLPYLCHSASQSIGSRNASTGVSSSRSSSTLRQSTNTKAQRLPVTVSARPSNGEHLVVQASGQRCEWKPCWDVI